MWHVKGNTKGVRLNLCLFQEALCSLGDQKKKRLLFLHYSKLERVNRGVFIS